MGILSWLTGEKSKEVKDVTEEVVVIDKEEIKELLLKNAKLIKMHGLQSKDAN